MEAQASPSLGTFLHSGNSVLCVLGTVPRLLDPKYGVRVVGWFCLCWEVLSLLDDKGCLSCHV